jgi:hypothetical protein
LGYIAYIAYIGLFEGLRRVSGGSQEGLRRVSEGLRRVSEGLRRVSEGLRRVSGGSQRPISWYFQHL